MSREAFLIRVRSSLVAMATNEWAPEVRTDVRGSLDSGFRRHGQAFIDLGFGGIRAFQSRTRRLTLYRGQ